MEIMPHELWKRASRDSLETRTQELRSQLAKVFGTDVLQPHDHQLFFEQKGHRAVTLHIDPRLKGKATITVEISSSKPRTKEELERYEPSHVPLTSVSFSEPEALKFLASEVNPIKNDGILLLKAELSSRHEIPSFVRGLKLLCDTASTFSTPSPAQVAEIVPLKKWLYPVSHLTDRMKGRFGFRRKI